jgi:hypothetical protein
MPAGVVLLALASASCSPFRSGREHYWEGMRLLRYDPAAAGEEFEGAAADLAEALSRPRLDVGEDLIARSIRIRCLIELDRHAEVMPLLSGIPQGFEKERPYEGDGVGLALIRAWSLDPERGYAELLAAEKRAHTLKARLHLAWQQVRLLEKIGKPPAKAEAARICALHAGKIDFDERRKKLQPE